ncbi:MAG: hypothetical protein KKE20_03705 [Nanoarchaeota archaeon]|nr:hypothetical protein [Nanoarchaeota archaeon]
MLKEEIVNFIKESRDKGTSDDDIRSNLNSVGWEKTDIEEAFTATPKEEPKPEEFENKLDSDDKSEALKKSHKITPIIVIGVIALGLLISAGMQFFTSQQDLIIQEEIGTQDALSELDPQAELVKEFEQYYMDILGCMIECPTDSEDCLNKGCIEECGDRFKSISLEINNKFGELNIDESELFSDPGMDFKRLASCPSICFGKCFSKSCIEECISADYGEICVNKIKDDINSTVCCFDKNTNDACDLGEFMTSSSYGRLGPPTEEQQQLIDCSKAKLDLVKLNGVTQICVDGNSLSFTIQNAGMSDISSYEVIVVGDSIVTVPIDEVLKVARPKQKTLTIGDVGAIKQVRFTPYVNGEKCNNGNMMVTSVVNC